MNPSVEQPSRRLKPNAAYFSQYRIVCIDCGADPPVLGSPLGTTPPSARRSVDDADFVGEKRIQGDPREPWGPPHNFGRIRSFGKKYAALG